MRILIADDEGSIRLFLNRVLRKLDYEVIETCNGAEAWDTLQKEKIKTDLEAAAKVQTSLLPKSESIDSKIEFDWLFLPFAFPAGDIFNYFRLDNEHVGFYLH